MNSKNPFDIWLQTIEEDDTCALATIVQEGVPAGSYKPKRMFVSERDVISALNDGQLEREITQIARKKFTEKTPTSEMVTLQSSEGEELNVFIDLYVPSVEIMIFGAGHDAIPVAQYSVSLGLKTTVVDQREGFNTEKNFPGTKRLLVRPENFANEIKISSRTYVIIMNHHIEKDRETLKFVLQSKAPYVGVLGPKSRRIRMIDAIVDEGIHFSEAELEKMYSPVGLDIGADTSEEIAISILAEIIAIRNGHDGGFLKGSKHIHQYSKTK